MGSTPFQGCSLIGQTSSNYIPECKCTSFKLNPLLFQSLARFEHECRFVHTEHSNSQSAACWVDEFPFTPHFYLSFPACEHWLFEHTVFAYTFLQRFAPWAEIVGIVSIQLLSSFHSQSKRLVSIRFWYQAFKKKHHFINKRYKMLCMQRD